MSSVIFQPDATAGKDAYLASDAPTTNTDGSNGLFFGENVGSDAIYRPVVEFTGLDDSGQIPANSTINAATLSLWIRTVPAVTRTIRVFRLKRVWTETGVTWNKYNGTDDWETAGGSGTNDREATDIGSASVVSTAAQHDLVSITLTASKIQEMISGGVFTNNGFLLQFDTESNDVGAFYSSDEATFTGERPRLVVDYTEPITTSTTTSTSTTTTSTSTTTTSTSTTTTSTSTSSTTSTSSSTSTSTTTTSTSTSITTTSTSTSSTTTSISTSTSTSSSTSTSLTTTSTSSSTTISTSSSTTTSDALTFMVEEVEWSIGMDHPGS